VDRPQSGEERRNVAKLKERRAFLLASGGLVLLAHVVDVVQAGGPNWSAGALRVAWSLLLAASAVALLRGDRRLARLSSGVAAVGTALLYLALLWATGRSGSPLFSFAYVLVLLLPQILPEMLGVAMASSALLVAGAWAMLLVDGASWGESLGWMHVGVVAFASSWLLGLAQRRARRAERAYRQGEREALQRLADSERQSERLARLAATGRLAAEVAHEVNNPLAAAKSNAAFIRKQLASGDREQIEACSDLLVSLERISEAVLRLKREAAAEGSE
jgi:signal transduction histidine kinase